jgi:hypothetical protein
MKAVLTIESGLASEHSLELPRKSHDEQHIRPKRIARMTQLPNEAHSLHCLA